jgi:hypothetical protein
MGATVVIPVIAAAISLPVAVVSGARNTQRTVTMPIAAIIKVLGIG